MRKALSCRGLLLGLMAPLTVFAEGTLFKQDPMNTIHWFPYIVILGILFVVLFVLAKKSKVLVKTNSNCQIIEKIPVHHKTQVYVINYQGQRFLIADNQNALAIHSLQEVKPSI
jgi:flagellar biogenesis protein FliO